MQVFDRVLLTGGGGFIGSHLIEALKQQFPQTHITVIDSFITGQRQNLAPWQDESSVAVIEHDLTDILWLQQFLQEQPTFSLVLHFASPASPPLYQAHPIMTYQVNSTVTHELAAYATRVGARMLFASTSEVYGDPQVHPQPESYWGNVNPNGIRSCYDESKRMGETICGVHARDFGGDIRLIRIFNTYGPRMNLNDGRVIPDYCRNVLRGDAIRIFGDGQQTRSFCYVTDLVRGIITFVGTDGLAGETINLGNPGEFTMNELADELEKVVGHSIERKFLPLPADDPQRRKPDITKAQQLLQWQPTVPLAEGLAQTYQYFADNFEQFQSL